MREILFRGKRVETLEWVEGFYFREAGHFIKELPSAVTTPTHLVYPETIGQYTGIKDKNSKRIFEGDIFKFNDEIWSSSYTSCGMEYDSCEAENYGVVGFDEYSAKYDFVKYKYNENSVETDLHENGTLEFAAFLAGLEIVGNIHDNPELLEDT